jgi:dephospho-CoA kinase
MLLIGLTGGIATGKSSVGRLLRARGVPVVDADVLARDAVAPGSDALNAIRARFGAAVFAQDGSLDRKALGAVVFGDPEARGDLNAIVHPEVARRAFEALDAVRAGGHPVAVSEVPLLFEHGLDAMVDRTLVVACSDENQLRRLMARDGLDEAAARARIAAQLPLAEKRRRAHVVIENDGGPEELKARVDEAWARVTAPREA